MLKTRFKSSLFLFIALILLSGASQIQAQNKNETEPLIVSPSSFKLVASNIKFEGKKTSPNPKVKDFIHDSNRIFVFGNKAFYAPYDGLYSFNHEGLLEQDLKKDTSQLFSMLELANSAGWFVSDGKKADIPDGIYGLHRSGDKLWMGTSGIGLVVFDAKKRVWSRYDIKTNGIPGDHTNVDYADKNYVFMTAGEFPGAGLLVYSIEKKKFLRLEQVSTKLFSQFGHTTGMVQISVNHGAFASQPYMKMDWTFMLPKVFSHDDGNSYTFEIDFDGSKTVFTLTKKQLDNVFGNEKAK